LEDALLAINDIVKKLNKNMPSWIRSKNKPGKALQDKSGINMDYSKEIEPDQQGKPIPGL
jgi:hypothetical protein